ncbi:RNA-directed DNA polymerase, eukaryota [Tanacetum coccineum]
MAIRGVSVNGEWVVDPTKVKQEFFQHFANRFSCCLSHQICFLNEEVFLVPLNKHQHDMLEEEVTNVEIKKAVWDCGRNKSPGPDGFTFEFIRKFWEVIGGNVCWAVKCLFRSGSFLKGCNPSFIALIPKVNDAKFVKDFRPICLIGSQYKIVGKILANRLSDRLVQPEKEKDYDFKVDFENAYDSVKWDFLDMILYRFGFGDTWRGWIKGCLVSSSALILVNGSPTQEFCFEQGLRINIHKFCIMGIGGVTHDEVTKGAQMIGCKATKIPFKYLGVMVGGKMNRIHTWDLIINKVVARLSKWKAKILSIGGRFTLTKSVLSTIPLYYFLLFKVPKEVLKHLESCRSSFFRGMVPGTRKVSWFSWDSVVASKEVEGLGFKVHPEAMWVSIIKAIHRPCGNLDWDIMVGKSSTWLDCIRSISYLKGKGMDLYMCMKKKAGNGNDSLFWLENWLGEGERQGGAEAMQIEELTNLISSFEFVVEQDNWVWNLDGEGVFSVSPARRFIDEGLCVMEGSPTRWLKLIPIKVNVLAWRLASNKLPTGFNMSLRGLEVPSIDCPVCHEGVETSDHLFFSCSVASSIEARVVGNTKSVGHFQVVIVLARSLCND